MNPNDFVPPREVAASHDPVLEAFLRSQYRDAMALAGASDILELKSLDGPLSRQYVARFHCRGLVLRDGNVEEADSFTVGINFARDYLRRVDPYQTVVLFRPAQTWHPNIQPPFMCLGPIKPGTSITDLIYRTFELLTWTKCRMREDDALNHDACVWARQNQLRLPLDRRPLKRLTSFGPGVGSHDARR